MIESLKFYSGVAGILRRDNIDTDQIIPSREMKGIRQTGLAAGLFAGWRYLDPSSRSENPDFVLNQIYDPSASILVSGLNFGCGSSREHAAWALREYGIRVVIAKSFGEIFHGNCFRNGILPVTLRSDEVDLIADQGSRLEISVSLEDRWVRCGQLPDWQAGFEIGDYPRRLLMEGVDPIGLTLKQADLIEGFAETDRARRPWVYFS